MADMRRPLIRLQACAILFALLLATLSASDARRARAHAAPANQTGAQESGTRDDSRTPRTLSVAVTDEKGNFIKGLKQDGFNVFDGKHRQDIVSFGDAGAPLSVGILLDASGSMSAPGSPKRTRASISSEKPYCIFSPMLTRPTSIF
jgi:hypothetical protein